MHCGSRCAALLVSAAVFALYATTIVPTVGWTDTGELMAVAYTFGTAHPTGYPLLTTLARAWLLVPTGLREAAHLNLLSALFVASATGVFLVVLARTFAETRKKTVVRHVGPAAAAALMLATSQTYWTQSSSYEVYALHLLLMAVILASYGSAVAEQENNATVMSRWWFLFAFTVGLSFANHMTTILLAPGLLWDYFRRHGLARASWLRVGRMVLPAVLGLSVYAALPVRAAVWPPLNWGDPSTWEGFWRHVSGAQYRVWMFNGTDVMSKQWKLFLDGLPSEFVWPSLMLAGWGWLVAWRRWRRQAEFMTIFAAAGIVYAVNFDIHEIGPYFLVVYVSLAFALVPGVIDLHERAASRRGYGRFVVPVAVTALIGWQTAEHHQRVPASNTPAVEQFARCVLEHVGTNAVVMTGRWDYLYSPALYLQHVEGVRTDVLLIDHSLLRDRSWYVEGLRRRAPWLARELSSEFEWFVQELRKFERGEPFVPAVIQQRWNALQSGILRVSMRERPVYLDMRLAAEIPIASAVPDGYVQRIGGAPIPPVGALPEPIPVSGNETAYLSDFRDYLAISYLRHGQAALGRGEWGVGDSLAAVAASFSPRHPALAAYALSRKKLGH